MKSPDQRRSLDELIVICACCNYDSVKVIDQHIAEQLSQHTPVLYVDPPLSPLTSRRRPDLAVSVREPQLRRIAPNLWRLTPIVAPYPRRRFMLAATQKIVRFTLHRAAREIGLPVGAIISGWSDIAAFGTCGERLRVWWAQDDYSAAASAGLVNEAVGQIALGEQARAAESDVIVAVSPVIAERWTRAGYDVEMIPNGTDTSHLANNVAVTPAEDVDLPSPIAILVGRLNERTDPALLHAVADRGVSILLVGPDAGASWLGALLDRPNVAWVGSRPFDVLPRYFAHANVGLVPYLNDEFNRASFPLKMLEYPAAGLPAVVSDLPAARWLNASADIVRIASGPDAYAEAVVEAARPDKPGDRERRRAFACEHSYERRADELLSLIRRRAEPHDTIART